MLKNKSFAFKLNFYVLTSASIIFLASFLFNYYLTRQIILSKVESIANSIAYQNLYKIENVLDRVEKVPMNIARLLEINKFKDTQLHNTLQSVVRNNPDIFGSTIAFEPGTALNGVEEYSPYYYKDSIDIAYADLGKNSYKYHEQEWYTLAKKAGLPLWTEPYFDEGGGNILMTTYSVPFYQKTKNGMKFWGIITADLSLDWLHDIISNVKVLDSGYAFLLSPSGEIISHRNKNFIMQENIFDLVKREGNELTKSVINKMYNEKEGLVHYYSLELKSEAEMYFTTIPSSYWKLAIVFPAEELYATLDLINKVLVFFGLVFLAVLFIVIKLFSNKLTKPLMSLSSATKLIAKGNLDITLPLLDSGDEVAMLSDSMRAMLKDLRSYISNLQDTTAEKEKIQSELRIAHDIQMGMIPKSFPPFPSRKEIDIFAALKPAKEVGGDLYDYFFIDENNLCITVGDVSGKGVPASLLMAVTRTLLRANAKPGMKSDELVNLINRNLCEDNDSRLFVTLFLGIINLATGDFDCTNAGHNRPLILKADGTLIEANSSPNFPVGISLRKPYEATTEYFEPGDRLILFTDGITEAMNTDGIMYEDDRLQRLLKANHKNTAKDLTQIILNDVKMFCNGADQYDDETVLIFEFISQNLSKELSSLFFE